MADLNADSRRWKLLLVDNFIWVMLVASILGFTAINGLVFFSITNLRYVVYSTAALSFLVMAEGICLLSGNFDLSIGQTAGFAGMFTGVMFSQWAPWMPWYGGVVVILLVGIVIGAVNGALIAIGDLNPFLVTLGTYLILQYGTLELSLNTIRSGFPDVYLAIGGASIVGIPYAVFVFVTGAVILYIFLRHTRFGGYIYAVGGNPESARRVGVQVDNVVLWVFILSGLLSAISGLLFTGFLGAATPGMADGSLFMAFAGAVIGGASLTGGRGSILNMVAGALLIGVFQGGLVMAGVGGNQTQIFFGLLVIVSIVLNRFRERIRDELLMPG